MLTIHKYPLSKAPGVQLIEVPQGARLLKAANQFDKICLWYEVDTDRPKVQREILLYQTGTEIDACSTGKFIDTILLDGGNYVVHLYERFTNKDV